MVGNHASSARGSLFAENATPQPDLTELTAAAPNNCTEPTACKQQQPRGASWYSPGRQVEKYVFLLMSLQRPKRKLKPCPATVEHGLTGRRIPAADAFPKEHDDGKLTLR